MEIDKLEKELQQERLNYIEIAEKEKRYIIIGIISTFFLITGFTISGHGIFIISLFGFGSFFLWHMSELYSIGSRFYLLGLIFSVLVILDFFISTSASEQLYFSFAIVSVITLLISWLES